ncbi:MAG TPA: arylesterase [Povalibacter sp.]|nr:arylesterase [Povalibacter sp.]
MTVRRLLVRCAIAAWFALLLPISSAGAASESGTAPVILIVGDSLSAGYGVRVDATWVALLQKRLAEKGYGYRVVNASESGETTGGANTRLPHALQLHRPALVVLELGGNDGLRGLPLKQIRANFESMLTQIRAAGARAVLVGMRIPANYGPAYADQFHALYADLGRKFGVPTVSGFIEGVALDATMMQADGIHPNAQAQPLLLDAVWPTLAQLLKK